MGYGDVQVQGIDLALRVKSAAQRIDSHLVERVIREEKPTFRD
jgi:hypothetical protein